ncbi:MAG: hypothetical protein DRP82_02905 [Planctomycetota bacterium]|nr:MAG: hypothetical protein DRP82_02905 [Planctomycetota bacterium]
MGAERYSSIIDVRVKEYNTAEQEECQAVKSETLCKFFACNEAKTWMKRGYNQSLCTLFV